MDISEPYVFKMDIERVVDADTVDVEIDVGFKLWTRQRIRLLNVDAPERHTERGKELTLFVNNWFEDSMKRDDTFYIQTYRSDSFGRYLGDIFSVPQDDDYEVRHLNELLLEQDDVKVWNR